MEFCTLLSTSWTPFVKRDPIEIAQPDSVSKCDGLRLYGGKQIEVERFLDYFFFYELGHFHQLIEYDAWIE